MAGTPDTAVMRTFGLGGRATARRDVTTGTGPGRWGLVNLLAAACYGVFGLAVSWFFAAYSLFPAPIWLPSSVAVVAAMAGGIRVAPGLFLGSLFVNYVVFDPPLYEAAIISVCNALGPVAGAALTRRLQPATGLFSRFSGVVVFIACNVVLHPALTASGGTCAIGMAGMLSSQPLDAAALYSIWLSWWLSDSGGTLFFAPALLLWLGIEKPPTPLMGGEPPVGERGDAAVWTAVAIITAALFAPLPHQGSIHWALPFLLVLPVSWVALRMSLRAAYSLISLVAVLACVGTVAGYGPFRLPGAGNPLQLVGLLVVILALNVLTIVALLNERRAAEETSKVKSQFLANMSHDLRTPLNAIIGFADMMRSETFGPVENPRYRAYVDHIHESGLMLLGLMNDILDLSKIEAGRREMHPEDLDWRRIVDSCLLMVGPKVQAKNIGIDATADPAVGVYADDMAFRQILLNLLSNAVKFTPRDGRVTIRLALAPDGATVLEVADTGVGMDAEEVRTALEPYGQVRAVARGREPGTGLGLPISVRLAELHGGRLAIDSVKGRGTTVRVVFPARAA